MFIHEYGDKNDPLVLLLAPMMVSGEDLYRLIHPYFRRNYHFIAPDQGGHGKAGAYISADEEYKALLDNPLTALGELNRVCIDGGMLIIPTYINKDAKGKTSGFAGAVGKTGADFSGGLLWKATDSFSWPQVLKKRGILTLIWIAGAAIIAGIVMLL